MVAVKVIEKKSLNEKTLQMLLQEITVMDMINHPNLVKLYGLVETSKNVQLVMQLATGGDLFTQLTEHGILFQIAPSKAKIFTY